MPAALWHDLGVPVALAFVTFDRRRQRWIAVCPSPAGATEMPLPSDAWGEVALTVPLVAQLHPGIESLLICGGQHHVGGDRAGDLEAFLAPTDICYRLMDSLRTTWHGFHGGDEAWRAIDAFLVDLRAGARRPSAAEDAAP